MRSHKEDTARSSRWVVTSFLAALVLLVSQDSLAQVKGQEEELDARKVFEKEKCGLCHSVASLDISATAKNDKLIGPDIGGFTSEDPAALIAYLRQEEKKEGKKHRRAAKASDEELQALLDWLAALEPAA